MTHPLRRRDLIAGGLALFGCGCGRRAEEAQSGPRVPPPAANPDDPLARLRDGNARFAAGRTRHAHESADWRRHLVAGQHPFAVVLGCSDSRVPPELVFDQGFGELFVVRVAGNVIAEDVLGSVEYAVRHLSVSMVVVLGHDGCGAVQAAVAALDGRGEEPEHIARLVRLIQPGLRDLPAPADTARLARAVELNARYSAGQLRKLPEWQRAGQPHPRIVAAVYDLATGVVRFFDD